MRLGGERIDSMSTAWPTWPPLLATRGPGAASTAHAHHAMHVVVAIDGELRFRAGSRGVARSAAGLVSAPDAPHSIDATDTEILLVFVDPESDQGAALRAIVGSGARAIDGAARTAILRGGKDPMAIMRGGGALWMQTVLRSLGGDDVPATRPVHPRVKKLLGLLRALPPDADTSLPSLAALVGLSPGRLMHAFTSSIGTPLRPYLTWLRLQRAAAAIVSGMALTDAAHGAGFSDAAHMTRTFRRMFGMTPSSLRPRAT